MELPGLQLSEVDAAREWPSAIISTLPHERVTSRWKPLIHTEVLVRQEQEDARSSTVMRLFPANELVAKKNTKVRRQRTYS